MKTLLSVLAVLPLTIKYCVVADEYDFVVTILKYGGLDAVVASDASNVVAPDTDTAKTPALNVPINRMIHVPAEIDVL